MIEQDRVRTFRLHPAPDGTIDLYAQIEHAFVDDAGAIIAVKPGVHTVTATIPVDDKLWIAATERVMAIHADEMAAAKQRVERAEHALASMPAAADTAAERISAAAS